MPERAAAKAGPAAKIARGAQTRRKLLDAARALFIERGYHGARAQDISRAANVGHGTFYLHFTDKLDCFFAVLAEVSALVDALVAERIADATDISSLIYAAADAVSAHAADNPGILALIAIDPKVIDPTIDRAGLSFLEQRAQVWAHTCAALQVKGQIAGDLDAKVIGYAVVGVIHQTLMAVQKGVFTRQELMDNIVPFIVRALVPPGTASTVQTNFVLTETKKGSGP
jgi:AcrR family transcriptional regulator